MELIVVGCSGSVSGPDSPASCYLVQAPHQGRTYSLVVDLGPGSLGALYRYFDDPAQVDAIALSHLHPDHCLDVCAFYVASRYSATAPWPRIPLYAPSGAAERLARAYEVPPADSDSSDWGGHLVEHFDFHEWPIDEPVGPFDVRTVRVDHPVPAYAIRISERATGRSLVFSGDTGPCQALVDLATGVDLLLVESAFMDSPDNPRGVHLSGRQAAEIGTAAGAKEIMLTHIPPWHDPAEVLSEAVAATDTPVTLAASGARRVLR